MHSILASCSVYALHCIDKILQLDIFGCSGLSHVVNEEVVLVDVNLDTRRSSVELQECLSAVLQ